MQEQQLPNIDDKISTDHLDLPNIGDKVKSKWNHDKLISVTMTSAITETAEGRPQLEVTLNSQGAQQKFWARINEPRSNWVLSRFVLPYINLVRQARGQELYSFGTELEADTLVQYIKSPWVQQKMTQGIDLRAVTTVRDGTDARGNTKRTVSCEFIHLSDDGSQRAFESIKAMNSSATAVETAKAVNGAIMSKREPFNF